MNASGTLAESEGPESDSDSSSSSKSFDAKKKLISKTSKSGNNSTVITSSLSNNNSPKIQSRGNRADSQLPKYNPVPDVDSDSDSNSNLSQKIKSDILISPRRESPGQKGTLSELSI